MLFFYTGAEQNRPTYRRGILDTLSYPAGHLLEYSYRVRNIQGGLHHLKGKAAAIVLVDMDGQQPHYMPVRLATVLSESVPASEPNVRIPFLLRLGDFVRYPNGERDYWHAKMSHLDTHRKFQNHQPTFFVIESMPPEPAWEQASNQDARLRRNAWEEVVTAVSKSAQLGKAVFLKLDLRDLQGPELSVFEPWPDSREYRLRSGMVYGLDICVYKGQQGGTTDTKIALSSSSQLMEVGQSFQSAVSGLAEHSSLVSCKRTVGDNLIALGVAAEEPETGVVNTPNPFLLLRVSISRTELAWFVVLVLAGGFLASLDPDSIKEACAACGKCKFAAVIAKLIGAGFLALAAYVGFRKLPSSNG